MKPLTVTVEQTRHSAVISGPVRVVHPAIKAVGCAWQYDHRRHAYLVPRRHLDDVSVAIELAGHHVQLEMSPW